MDYDLQQARDFFRRKLAFTTGPHELAAAIDARRDDFAIVDVRYPGDFRKGHIPGAVSLPKGQWASPRGLAKDKLNILYCYSQTCHLAAEAALELLAQGYRVAEMEGGFAAWEANGSPVEARPAREAA